MTDRLIVTVDYEVFGNGRGCVRGCVIDPADRLLELARSRGVPLTIFVEATEFAAMERAGFSAIAQVKEQLRRVHDEGHDIGLHIHPQWWQAPYNGRWEVLPQRRIADLPPQRIADLLEEGLGWLTGVVADWTCTAFRAGALCIQPSEAVAAALIEAGIRVDSSVAPDRFLAGESWFDFRNMPDRTWWRTGGDVGLEGPGPLIEVPIATGRISHRSDLAALLRIRGRRNPPGCSGGQRFYPLLETASRVAGLGRIMLDFCRHDRAVLSDIAAGWRARGGEGSPVVAIGHTKDTTDRALENLGAFIDSSRAAGMEPGTFGDWLG